MHIAFKKGKTSVRKIRNSNFLTYLYPAILSQSKAIKKMIQVTLNTKTKNIDSKENAIAFLNSVTIKEIAHCHMSLIERTHFKACYARQTFVKK